MKERLLAEKDLSKLCGDLCREAFEKNDFKTLNELITSPDFQLAIETAKLQELIAKQNRQALQSTVEIFNEDVSWQ